MFIRCQNLLHRLYINSSSFLRCAFLCVLSSCAHFELSCNLNPFSQAPQVYCFLHELSICICLVLFSWLNPISQASHSVVLHEWSSHGYTFSPWIVFTCSLHVNIYFTCFTGVFGMNIWYEKNRALRALIFSALRAACSLRELGACGPKGWPSATGDHWAQSDGGDVRGAPAGRRRRPRGSGRTSSLFSPNWSRMILFNFCWTKE